MAPRQPIAAKAGAIAAAAHLLANGQPVSIGAVARLAKLSKGAVQHHFGTREELLTELYRDLLARFETELNALAPVSAAQAYTDATMRSAVDTNAAEGWRALLAATVIERQLASLWSEWVERDRKRTAAESTAQLAARLAADGLWLSDTLGTYKLENEERARIESFIRDLAKSQ